jgi:predicted branched-subunit amino acid permease
MSVPIDFFINDVFGNNVIIAVFGFFLILLVLSIVNAKTDIKLSVSALYSLGCAYVFLPMWIFSIVTIFLGVVATAYIKQHIMGQKYD